MTLLSCEGHKPNTTSSFWTRAQWTKRQTCVTTIPSMCITTVHHELLVPINIIITQIFTEKKGYQKFSWPCAHLFFTFSGNLTAVLTTKAVFCSCWRPWMYLIPFLNGRNCGLTVDFRNLSGILSEASDDFSWLRSYFMAPELWPCLLQPTPIKETEVDLVTYSKRGSVGPSKNYWYQPILLVSAWH